MPVTQTKCINCNAVRSCLLIVAYIPIADAGTGHIPGYDEALRTPICRTCLRETFGGMSLGGYIAENAR